MFCNFNTAVLNLSTRYYFPVSLYCVHTQFLSESITYVQNNILNHRLGLGFTEELYEEDDEPDPDKHDLPKAFSPLSVELNGFGKGEASEPGFGYSCE